MDPSLWLRVCKALDTMRLSANSSTIWPFDFAYFSSLPNNHITNYPILIRTSMEIHFQKTRPSVKL